MWRDVRSTELLQKPPIDWAWMAYDPVYRRSVPLLQNARTRLAPSDFSWHLWRGEFATNRPASSMGWEMSPIAVSASSTSESLGQTGHSKPKVPHVASSIAA